MSDQAKQEAAKDLPLKEDIRLLGRILGDTVRAQEGEATFDLIERVRQTSIRFGRDDDVAAIGFAYSGASDRLAELDADRRAAGLTTAGDHDYEAMLEVSYRYKVTPWMTLVPDAQYIMHPGGTSDYTDSNGETIKDAVILGLRTVLTL